MRNVLFCKNKGKREYPLCMSSKKRKDTLADTEMNIKFT